ncbi:hypothetical protein AO072_02850 [Pseudomonas syringae ICMP 13102]|nr:hypothetical protein AO069_20385 [Pseudomonas syringae pv. syringae PD2774]KTB89517.1 hypothetical protein AO072_02850 [Pseudomonas syringae ICMP 13102]KWS08464.1 hypothetical protein AL064_17695 [Pseudomonas syringae pv. syringae]KWS25080.1 hypothetical protein AL062_11895 [Pseudomonas syringae pv. syringae]KWS26104.1 hypothetical protein AL061_16515 [Pseudomonas syringae pv. syringae]
MHIKFQRSNIYWLMPQVMIQMANFVCCLFTGLPVSVHFEELIIKMLKVMITLKVCLRLNCFRLVRAVLTAR